jgi:hypothetical protein
VSNGYVEINTGDGRGKATMKKHTTSLVDVTPGEGVTVRQILFDGLRDYCADLGIHEGCRFTLLEGDPSKVLLRGAGGAVVRCPVEFARFVEVARDKQP